MHASSFAPARYARHRELHRTDRIGWLRASVLGANDGLISTASLVVGVASTGATPGSVAVSAAAGLLAGAMSMAAGEYVSVSSQADTERADLEKERHELATDEPGELAELASIYVSRGLDRDLADRVAEQLMAHDALGAHARDELGMYESTAARPIQAALSSAASFAVGAALPALAAALVPGRLLVPLVAASTLVLLAGLGGLAARIGGAPMWTGAGRVTFWGALAMGVTAAAGALFGAVG
ncbi:MAG: VIT family protein [Thermoanaerobaculia bacterium]|nr:VIT family protein [Thermoanaerobaculia bacterium]